MTVQELPGGFSTYQITPPFGPDTGINVFDLQFAAATVNQAVRTPGATLTQLISYSPEQKPWSLQSIGFQAGVSIDLTAKPIGKLGKIVAGLVLPPAQSIPSGQIISPVIPLPNPTLTVDLWDPANDPLPPEYVITSAHTPSPQSQLQVSGILQLQQPVQIQRGEQIQVGLWILPSLLSFQVAGTQWTLQVVQAQWRLVYDDGLL